MNTADIRRRLEAFDTHLDTIFGEIMSTLNDIIINLDDQEDLDMAFSPSEEPAERFQEPQEEVIEEPVKAKRHYVKLTEDQVKEIKAELTRRNRANGLLTSQDFIEVGAPYGSHRATIRDIAVCRGWNNVPWPNHDYLHFDSPIASYAYAMYRGAIDQYNREERARKRKNRKNGKNKE